jgi:hypothetical protein
MGGVAVGVGVSVYETLFIMIGGMGDGEGAVLGDRAGEATLAMFAEAGAAG